MTFTRRQATRAFFGWAAASPIAGLAQDFDKDPLYGPLNVMDFAKAAKAKLDPLAWDYLDGGS